MLILDTKAEKIPNITTEYLFQVKIRLLNMTWSNLRFNVGRSFVVIATNLPSCFLILIFRAAPEVSTKLYFVEIS